MKIVSVKTLIPALLLIPILVGLALTLRYAIRLDSTVEVSDSLIFPAETQGGIVVPPREPAVSPAPISTDFLIPAEDSQTNDPDDVEASPFWSDGILFIGNEYRSPSLVVKVSVHKDSKTWKKPVVYYVADICVKDVTQIRTASSGSGFDKNGSNRIKTVAKNADALAAISGDYYACHKTSLVIRNGILYRKKTGYGDVCLLLRNGEMKTIPKEEVDLDAIIAMDPWQAWEFGPELIDRNGHAKTKFPGCTIAGENPRSCIGCIEPGHYLFVTVDGRQSASRGLTLKELAALMQSLGCTKAYNLDGGASSQFYWKGTVYNKPSKGGRKIADIIYVAKESYPASQFYAGKTGSSN